MYTSLKSSSLHNSELGLFGGDFGLKKINETKCNESVSFEIVLVTYLSRGEARRELAKDTTRLEPSNSR